MMSYKLATEDWGTKSVELERLSAEELLAWAFQTFLDGIAFASSFQAESSVLIYMAHRLRGSDFRIVPWTPGGSMRKPTIAWMRYGSATAWRSKCTFPTPLKCKRWFDEILRVIDSLQLTDAHRVATPVNWKQGEDVIMVPAVTDEEAKAKFPKGWKALKPYLRLTPQPK